MFFNDPLEIFLRRLMREKENFEFFRCFLEVKYFFNTFLINFIYKYLIICFINIIALLFVD